jgi:proteasome lid subunit RPN8/RPN11
LQWFCHHDEVEIGGFGITSPDDLLLIEEFSTVKQDVSLAHVAFDDEAVAEFFEDQVDQGRRPEQFARIWCHSHPGASPEPSGTDEETFDRVFGACDWAVMFILAETGNTYARLRFSVGPRAELLIPVQVDYKHEFGGSDHKAWLQEYERNVQVNSSVFASTPAPIGSEDECLDWLKKEDQRFENWQDESPDEVVDEDEFDFCWWNDQEAQR